MVVLLFLKFKSLAEYCDEGGRGAESSCSVSKAIHAHSTMKIHGLVLTERGIKTLRTVQIQMRMLTFWSDNFRCAFLCRFYLIRKGLQSVSRSFRFFFTHGDSSVLRAILGISWVAGAVCEVTAP